jgi:hypothetical protein
MYSRYSMDMAARSIDLLTIPTEMADSPNSSTNRHRGCSLAGPGTVDRELVTRSARGLALANAQGHRFYDTVVARTQTHAPGPLFVQQSGSLVRMMARDPYLCWVTSTIASLFEFQREDFISDVLCSFLMQAHLFADGKQ